MRMSKAEHSTASTYLESSSCAGVSAAAMVLDVIARLRQRAVVDSQKVLKKMLREDTIATA